MQMVKVTRHDGTTSGQPPCCPRAPNRVRVGSHLRGHPFLPGHAATSGFLIEALDRRLRLARRPFVLAEAFRIGSPHSFLDARVRRKKPA